MVTIFLGPPGVGKGTQAKQLADARGWAHVSTGDLLRQARRDGTPLGRKAQGYMDAGELVPDALILDLVREHLEELGSDASVIFDGFPRTVPQAEGLARLLDELDRGVDAVLLFEAADDTLVKRIAGRRSCPGCDRVYNVHFTPPTHEGRCDACGSALTHRADDEPETVQRRLQVYRDQTEPLIAHYARLGPEPIRIDAEQPVEAVQAATAGALVGAGEEAA